MHAKDRCSYAPSNHKAACTYVFVRMCPKQLCQSSLHVCFTQSLNFIVCCTPRLPRGPSSPLSDDHATVSAGPYRHGGAGREEQTSGRQDIPRADAGTCSRGCCIGTRHTDITRARKCVLHTSVLLAWQGTLQGLSPMSGTHSQALASTRLVSGHVFLPALTACETPCALNRCWQPTGASSAPYAHGLRSSAAHYYPPST